MQFLGEMEGFQQNWTNSISYLFSTIPQARGLGFHLDLVYELD